MDATQIRFKAGQPLAFVTTRPFALGNFGITLARGTEFMFDGTKVEVDGMEYQFPQLRGAIKAGWVVLLENYDPEAVVMPQRANIQVRNPTQLGQSGERTAMATSVSEEERVIGDTRQHANQTRTANSGYVRGQTKVNMPRGVNAGQMVKTQRGMMVVEDQDGTVVERAPLRTLAGQAAKEASTPADAASEVISNLSKIKIDPVQGVSRDELLERMTEEEREQYLAEVAARKSAYVNEAPVVATQRTVVGSVAKKAAQQTEGFNVTTTAGGGVEVADPTGMGGKPTESVYEQEGVTFRSVNGPKRDLKPSTHPRSEAAAPTPVSAGPLKGLDARRTIAKALCPDFPDAYDFDLPTRKKLARITADFEERPDVIRAIFAAESDEVKALLIEQFPAAFESAA